MAHGHDGEQRECRWTPRQREVLDLLAKGYSNREIAQHLGISLDGAKWHVSEIMGKLDVISRDEAADYWIAERSIGRRATRWFKSVSPKPLLVGGGALVALAVGVGVVLSLLQSGPEPVAGDPTPQTGPPSQPSPDETPLPTPRPVPTIADLSSEPQPQVQAEVVDLDITDSPFPPSDPEKVVLYNVEAGEQTDLGMGHAPEFSPDGTRLAWVTGLAYDNVEDEVHIYDVGIAATTNLGTGGGVWWISNDEVVVREWMSNASRNVDLRTMESSPGGTWPNRTPDAGGMREKFGYVVMQANRDDEPDAPNFTYTLRDAETWDIIAAVEALTVMPLDRTTIVVATDPVGEDRLTNLYRVDLRSLEATFIVTAELGYRGSPAANAAGLVAWVDGACARYNGADQLVTPQGNVHVFDPASGRLVEFVGFPDNDGNGYRDLGVRFLDDHLIGIGVFGVHTIVDTRTMTVVANIPRAAAEAAWTTDYRMAAVGGPLGHGGLCI